MDFKDIQGRDLVTGQRVAWATVGRGGVLATGVVTERGTLQRETRERSNQAWDVVFVRLDSNGRVTEIPYNLGKFVVLAEPQAQSPSLLTRVRELVRRQPQGQLFSTTDMREALKLPQSDAFLVFEALQTLCNLRELAPGAMSGDFITVPE